MVGGLDMKTMSHMELSILISTLVNEISIGHCKQEITKKMFRSFIKQLKAAEAMWFEDLT